MRTGSRSLKSGKSCGRGRAAELKPHKQAPPLLRESAVWPNIVPGRVCDQSGCPPEALPDSEWTEDPAFNAGDAILADPLLKEVYKEAILKGCARVNPKP